MTVTVTKDILYNTQYNILLDVYEPEQCNECGVIVIHGGGWFHGDKSKDEDWARMIAEAGYVVVAPNYRLAPQYLYPAAKDDIFMVYRWFIEKYRLRGIGVAGSSSGGNLSIELGLATGIPTVSLSGIINLDDWIENHPAVKPRNDTQQDFSQLASAEIDQDGPNDSFYKWFVLNYVGNDPAKLRDASLLRRVTGAAGPMLLVNSMNELSPVGAVIRLQKSLLREGVPVTTKCISGGKHAKGYLHTAHPYAMDFFAEYLLQSQK